MPLTQWTAFLVALSVPIFQQALFAAPTTSSEISSRWGVYARLVQQGWWQTGPNFFKRYSWVEIGKTMRIQGFDRTGKVLFNNVVTMNGGLAFEGESLDPRYRNVTLTRQKIMTANGDQIWLSDDAQSYSAINMNAGGQPSLTKYVAVAAPGFASRFPLPDDAQTTAGSATPIATSAATSAYGHAFLLRPDGTRNNFALGNEYKLTQGVVTQPKKDLFSAYLFTIILKGAVGDRFLVSWNSAEAVNLDYGYDRNYDVDYPDGATIFDKTTSMTVTLKQAGEHRLTFSQIGMSYPKTSGGGHFGPSFANGTPRPFATTFIKVSRAGKAPPVLPAKALPKEKASGW